MTVEISRRRTIELVTNDLKTPAVEIARLDEARWDIGLFFKWIKQDLKIQCFLRTNRKAVTLRTDRLPVGAPGAAPRPFHPDPSGGVASSAPC